MRIEEAKAGKVVSLTGAETGYDLRVGSVGIVAWGGARGNATVHFGALALPIPVERLTLSSVDPVGLRESIMEGMAAKANVSLGADPEIFAKDQEGQVIPAWEWLPEKKPTASPQCFWDGFQAEFTVSPYFCIAYAVDEVQSQLRHLHSLLRKRDASLSPACVVDIPYQTLRAVSTEQASLGCAPSLNIYPDESPLVVEDTRALLMRFAGYHVHFGLRGLTEEDAVPIVYALDELCGIGMTAALDGMEDGRRRRYYGRAGEHRLPEHGLEYRVPSSVALQHPVLTQLLYHLARTAVRLGALRLRLWEDVSVEEVRRIINETDGKAARKLLRDHSATVGCLFRDYPNIPKLLYRGALDTLPMNGMVRDWRLGLTAAWGRHSASRGAALGNTVLREASSV